MKRYWYFLIAILLVSCQTARPVQNGPAINNYGFEKPDPLTTQSLFNDKNATISEENIRNLLDGEYQLPTQFRVAVIKLDAPVKRDYITNEYLKNTEQAVQTFTKQLSQSPRVKR